MVLLLFDKFLELRGGVGSVLAVVVVDEEDSLYVGVVGMAVDELQRFVETHDHESCGHGIGIPSLLADDGDAEEGVADGTAVAGVDGVGVAHAVLLVVFAVVARSDNGLVVQLDGGLYLLFTIFCLGRPFDAHSPTFTIGLCPTGDDFATDVDEVVVDAEAVEELCDQVDGVALCDGVEVVFYLGMFAEDEVMDLVGPKCSAS